MATLSLMARIRRVVAVGYPQHVAQRGNFRRNVFLDDEDRESYLALLAKNASAAEQEILGYCLKTNHVHLIVVPKKRDSMATTFRRVHGSDSPWRNIRLRQTGHAWQSRYFSSPLGPSPVAYAMRDVEFALPAFSWLLSGGFFACAEPVQAAQRAPEGLGLYRRAPPRRQKILGEQG